MSDKKPFVSIIIPVYHDWNGLARALEALDQQTYPREQYEIIVVNNDPADPFPDSFTGLNNVCCAYQAHPGSYAARNKGMHISQGSLLGFCDADCIPASDWIAQAVELFRVNPECFRIAGGIELVYEDPLRRSLAEMHESVFAFRQELYAQKGLSATANMLARREVFEAVGLFDEDLLSGGDLEWGQRAHDAGFTICYAPDVLVSHPARRSIQELAQKCRRVCTGYIRIHQAHCQTNPGQAVYHGLSMLKPPLQAGRMIWGRADLRFQDKIRVYMLEYYLKLVQLGEFIRLQRGKR